MCERVKERERRAGCMCVSVNEAMDAAPFLKGLKGAGREEKGREGQAARQEDSGARGRNRKGLAKAGEKRKGGCKCTTRVKSRRTGEERKEGEGER